MSRTLASKLKFVVVVLAVLAMMIPTAIPVAAAAPVLTMYLVNPMTGDVTEPDGGYNIQGTNVYVTSNMVTEWSIDYSQGGVCTVSASDNYSITVDGGYGEVSIVGRNPEDNLTANVNKKWDTIDYTVFEDDYGYSTVTWNQSSQSFFASGSITDNVIGEQYGQPLQGAILNWYLVEATCAVDMTAMESDDLKAYVAGLNEADFVEFLADPYVAWDHTDASWIGTELTRENGLATVTDINGQSTVMFGAWGEEDVKIVVVPEYPNDPQLLVVPEVATWNFDTEEYEIVPQVRWIGEKIVLEKNFADVYEGAYVQFVITSGEGALEEIDAPPADFNHDSNGQSVWAVADADGVAHVILTADAANQVNVRATLYADSELDTVAAQQAFTVYFLKFESIHLSDVVGKRASHNAGVWTEPVNPYNDCFPYWADDSDTEDPNQGSYWEYIDVTTQNRNVSQDALERAQVKGWFMGVNYSTREAKALDVDADGEDDITLPQYRWVLPDDWDKLAGVAENRPRWDIMDSPKDNIVDGASATGIGPYTNSAGAHSGTPVVGPFTPGIEVMTPAGWSYAMTSVDPLRQIKTVVTDDLVNEWDAPMPPAKIIFKILTGNGYFKETSKLDIYQNAAGDFTNPFYWALIPAHWAIPAFNSQVGYDWDSFVETYGEYGFWTIINQYASVVPTTDPSGYPTAAEVYSDNHGEAMVYLNGDWNLDLDSYNLIGGKGGVDAMDGSEVGVTTLTATADYPYVRGESPVVSNTVTKTWYWNGMILGIDNHTYANYIDGDPEFGGYESGSTLNILSAGDYTLTSGNANPDYPEQDTLLADGRGYSNDKFIFVWARDRDALPGGMIRAKLEITAISDGTYIYNTGITHAISQYNWVTQGIFVDGSGFLEDCGGVKLTADTGYCYFREPTETEKVIFNKNWVDADYCVTPTLDANGEILDPDDFVVAGFDLYNSAAAADSVVDIRITSSDFGYVAANGVVYPMGQVDYTINVGFGEAAIYPLDDPIVAGDANNDGAINAADIIAIQNMIMEMTAPDVNGDATGNGSINMGDVVKVIRMTHGLD